MLGEYLTKKRGLSWAMLPGVFGLVLALVYLRETGRYPVGTVGSPGPGLFPTLVGWMMAIASFSAIVTEYLGASIRPQRPEPGFWRVIAISIAGFAFAWLMEDAGYVVATAVFCIIVFAVLERRRWWVIATLSICTAAITYFVFYNLRVPLPAGILPF